MSEAGMVTPRYAVLSIVTIRLWRPNGQTSRVGYECCVALVPVVVRDYGTAGKGEHEYQKQDGNYEPFHC